MNTMVEDIHQRLAKFARVARSSGPLQIAICMSVNSFEAIATFTL